MTRILQAPTFKRAVKRFHKRRKRELDGTVRAVAADPTIGERKLGDLAGLRVRKFKMNRQPALLAYEFIEADDVIKLLALGSHENFCRDIER